MICSFTKRNLLKLTKQVSFLQLKGCTVILKAKVEQRNSKTEKCRESDRTSDPSKSKCMT